jgi:hypothetical protein
VTAWRTAARNIIWGGLALAVAVWTAGCASPVAPSVSSASAADDSRAPVSVHRVTLTPVVRPVVLVDPTPLPVVVPPATVEPNPVVMPPIEVPPFTGTPPAEVPPVIGPCGTQRCSDGYVPYVPPPVPPPTCPSGQHMVLTDAIHCVAD